MLATLLLQMCIGVAFATLPRRKSALPPTRPGLAQGHTWLQRHSLQPEPHESQPRQAAHQLVSLLLHNLLMGRSASKDVHLNKRVLVLASQVPVISRCAVACSPTWASQHELVTVLTYAQPVLSREPCHDRRHAVMWQLAPYGSMSTGRCCPVLACAGKKLLAAFSGHSHGKSAKVVFLQASAYAISLAPGPGCDLAWPTVSCRDSCRNMRTTCPASVLRALSLRQGVPCGACAAPQRPAL